jgi:hypothetical protein
MRRVLPQAISASAFFGLVLVLIFSGIATGRGQIKVAVPTAAVKADVAKDKAKAETVDYITFPSDRDAKQKLQAVIDYLKGANPGNEKWEQICMAAQWVLDGKTDTFFESTSPREISIPAPDERSSISCGSCRVSGVSHSSWRRTAPSSRGDAIGSSGSTRGVSGPSGKPRRGITSRGSGRRAFRTLCYSPQPRS